MPLSPAAHLPPPAAPMQRLCFQRHPPPQYSDSKTGPKESKWKWPLTSDSQRHQCLHLDPDPSRRFSWTPGQGLRHGPGAPWSQLSLSTFCGESPALVARRQASSPSRSPTVRFPGRSGARACSQGPLRQGGKAGRQDGSKSASCLPSQIIFPKNVPSRWPIPPAHNSVNSRGTEGQRPGSLRGHAPTVRI